ncbi:hypothetical protein [Kocuria arenosa]|uniref:hypothetical protein n=1 Tax=Kocuria arenosa TaxID=3071446 RepID=UPI0034D52E44
MSRRAPQHRSPQSDQARRDQLQVLLALISLPFLLVFLIWFAVRTDNVLLGIGLAIGSVIGTWWRDKRKARKKAKARGN